MAQVDRNLQEIIRFCRAFDTEYLAGLRANAEKLKMIASSAEASLGGTGFSTKSSQSLESIAQQLIRASASGEERIREIERRAKKQEEERQRIESMFNGIER